MFEYLPNILLGGGLVGMGVFTVLYGKAADWRKTAPGRALMYLLWSMEAVLIMVFLHILLPPYAVEDFIRTAVYGLFFGAVWNLVRVLLDQLSISPLSVFGVKVSKPKDKP